MNEVDEKMLRYALACQEQARLIRELESEDPMLVDDGLKKIERKMLDLSDFMIECVKESLGNRHDISIKEGDSNAS